MQLLEYSTNDIRLEMQVQKAKVDYTTTLPSHTLSKTGGQVNNHTKQTTLRLDTYERRSSMGFKGIQATTDYMKQMGRQKAMEATRNYADTGNALRDIHKGANIPDAYYSQMLDTGSLGFQPLAPVAISWDEGFIKQDYETARLAFEWKQGQTQGNYTPGSVKFNVTQYPSIEFKYLGGPVYVPKSADPNYEKAI